MNKNDLVASVANTTGLNKGQAAETVDAVFHAITSALQQGDDVKLTGFGNFAVAQRKARTAINPQTRAPIDIPASKAPKFKPGKALKEAVNG